MEVLGCWQEAQNCDHVAIELLRIRGLTDGRFYEPITALVREVESTSRLLRDLHDLFGIYRTRVHLVVNYLTVILPCLQRTLLDMMSYIGYESFPAYRNWLSMLDRLDNQGRTPLAQRFVM
jgi:hypothetical protein